MCFESKQICFGIISGRGDITDGNDGDRCFGKKHVSPEFLCPFLTILLMLGLVSPRTLRDGQETESDMLSEDTLQKPEHERPEQALKAMTGQRTPNRREPITEPPNLMERSKTKADKVIHYHYPHGKCDNGSVPFWQIPDQLYHPRACDVKTWRQRECSRFSMFRDVA